MTGQRKHRRWRDCKAVVIGASAGGVDALRTVLSGAPRDFPVPVLVVLHLPRERPSTIVQLLARACELPVAEAVDKQPIEPGVLLAPPDYHLQVEPDRTVSLSRDEAVLYSRPAIDPLFESAAAVYGPALLGIVLTGASADGAKGLAAVRGAGGIGWVQDPAEAQAQTMPQAALDLAGADEVLALREIGRRLARWNQETDDE